MEMNVGRLLHVILQLWVECGKLPEDCAQPRQWPRSRPVHVTIPLGHSLSLRLSLRVIYKSGMSFGPEKQCSTRRTQPLAQALGDRNKHA